MKTLLSTLLLIGLSTVQADVTIMPGKSLDPQDYLEIKATTGGWWNKTIHHEGYVSEITTLNEKINSDLVNYSEPSLENLDVTITTHDKIYRCSPKINSEKILIEKTLCNSDSSKPVYRVKDEISGLWLILPFAIWRVWHGL